MKITINKKEYEVKPIDFNAICKLEEKGFSLADAQASKKTFNMLRALCALAMECDVDEAGKEIEAHLANGGKIPDFNVIFSNLANSDFFRNLSQQQPSEQESIQKV